MGGRLLRLVFVILKICLPDRSVAKWRDLFLFRFSHTLFRPLYALHFVSAGSGPFPQPLHPCRPGPGLARALGNHCNACLLAHADGETYWPLLQPNQFF